MLYLKIGIKFQNAIFQRALSVFRTRYKEYESMIEARTSELLDSDPELKNMKTMINFLSEKSLFSFKLTFLFICETFILTFVA